MRTHSEPRATGVRCVLFLVLTACGGYAEAGGGAWLPAVAALFGSIMIQVGTNFANDYFDYKKGADSDNRLGRCFRLRRKKMSCMSISGSLLTLVKAHCVLINS